MEHLTRREVLKGLGTATIGAAAWLTLRSTMDASPNPQRKRVLRVAHLTDTHIAPEGFSLRGLFNCLKAVDETQPRPDLLLFGGDAVSDVFAQNEERAKVLLELWGRVIKERLPIPARFCIGNHDVWGWNKERSGCTGNEPKFGKKWIMDLYELEKPYYSFEQAGWKFLVLDSTFPHGNDYKARLDDEQFEWLKGELQRTPATMPILVLSHIPIVSVCAMFDGENEKSGDWVVPGAWVHIDARRIVELFHSYKNVKLCLSGHIHLFDRVVYNNVTYICDGAVSGRWWGGNYHQTPPGWGLIDLYDDGSFEHEYRSYEYPIPTGG
ncbi:MAG: metallophosphoesterase family protein [Fimbriimonadales bacterium]